MYREGTKLRTKLLETKENTGLFVLLGKSDYKPRTPRNAVKPMIKPQTMDGKAHHKPLAAHLCTDHKISQAGRLPIRIRLKQLCM